MHMSLDDHMFIWLIKFERASQGAYVVGIKRQTIKLLCGVSLTAVLSYINAQTLSQMPKLIWLLKAMVMYLQNICDQISKIPTSKNLGI